MSDSGRKSTGIGVIGAGFHSRVNVIPALRLAEVPVVALATRSAASAQRAASLFGERTAAYGSADELLTDAAVAGVIIVAQPDDQVQIVEDAVRAGKHVLVEKPLGLTAEQARQVARLADQHGVSVSVAFMKRFAPVYRQLKAAIDDGTFGRLQSFTLAFACDSSSFAASPREHLLYAAIHMIDLTRWLFGEAGSVVTAMNRDGQSLSLSVAITFGSGVVGTLDLVSAPSRQSEVEAMTVCGDEGWAEATGSRELVIHRSAPSDGDFTGGGDVATRFTAPESMMSGGAADPHHRGFVGEMRHFEAVIRGERSPLSSAWDDVRTMELCNLILASTQDSPEPTEWALGSPGPVREEFVQRIVEGSKSGSTTLSVAYRMSGERMPAVGERRMLIDSTGQPAALVEYTHVHEGPLGEVPRSVSIHETAEHADFVRSHLEYFDTLAPDVRAFLGEDDWSPTSDSQVVSTVFRLIRAAVPSA
ncbi:MAG: Gfo/Idh/MocA family oxidoreductase [Microbacterium sp.]|uniref:Gfo/Idh/MocA family oxidoreductase n=1 Tax=Microbacterium sp. TaxID=51671 RepID=UPI003D6F1B71